MPKFFADNSCVKDNLITISGDDARHITKSLRLTISDKIIVSDFSGFEYNCEIIEISEGIVKLSILSKSVCSSDSPLKITLFQGIPKSDKLDLIVMKCTELGGSSVVPMHTKNCVAEIKPAKAEAKLARLNRIALEASKQCGRGTILSVESPVDIKTAFSMSKEYDLAVIPYENEDGASLKSVLNNIHPIKSIAVYIGPEGGFTENEVSLAKENGIVSVTLGKRILRTETAGMSVLSMLLYEYEL